MVQYDSIIYCKSRFNICLIVPQFISKLIHALPVNDCSLQSTIVYYTSFLRNGHLHFQMADHIFIANKYFSD